MSGSVLLLVGSPRHAKGASRSVAEYLAGRLRARGAAADIAVIPPAMAKASDRETLLLRSAAARVLILVSPLYVDSLPAPVMAWMEDYHARRRAAGAPGRQGIGAVIHCGFPEASQNATALGICEEFAAESGMAWLGGIPLGGAGALGGRPIEKAGGMWRHLRAGLDRAAGLWAEGRGVDGETAALASRPAMPRWLYAAAGNLGFALAAWRNGVLGSVRARPYEETDAPGA